MHRIDTTQETDRWEWGCPEAEHRNWRVVDGHFQCRSCDDIFDELVHLPTGDTVSREQIELVGPEADHLAAFDPREV